MRVKQEDEEEREKLDGEREIKEGRRGRRMWVRSLGKLYCILGARLGNL